MGIVGARKIQNQWDGFIPKQLELHTPTMYQKESAQSTTEKHRATATANTSMTARMTSYKLFQMENQILVVLQEQCFLFPSAFLSTSSQSSFKMELQCAGSSRAIKQSA